MLKWKDYRKEVLSRASELKAAVPDVMSAYAALGAASAKSAHLDGKTRELIALAVAVTTHCDGCIASHVEAALKYGATKEEIAEALGVAIALNAGAALVYSTRVMDCVAEYQT